MSSISLSQPCCVLLPEWHEAQAAVKVKAAEVKVADGWESSRLESNLEDKDDGQVKMHHWSDLVNLIRCNRSRIVVPQVKTLQVTMETLHSEPDHSLQLSTP